MALFGNKTPLSSLWAKMAAAAVVGVLTVGALGLFEEYFGSGGSTDVERAMQAARDAPLIGLVLRENPSLDQGLRAAAEEEIRHPTKRPLPSLQFGARLRAEYIIPALRNTDDASALAAVRAMEALARHLQTTDPAMCRDFGVTGIREPARLDARAKELLKKALALQEDAYRVGKQAKPRPALSDNQFVELLMVAGYKDGDLERLGKAQSLGVQEACDMTVKLYSAPSSLTPDKGGVLARWLLTVPQ
ncbi:MAG: hypothetical protein U1E60_21330 [Reyranellaceae bacterium]